MSVELPFAPVDAVIRRHAGSLRVSSEATEELAERIQQRGARLAADAAERATRDDRKTLQTEDFEADTPDSGELELPVAPVDRIARLDIDDRYRVARDARVALAGRLEAPSAGSEPPPVGPYSSVVSTGIAVHARALTLELDRHVPTLIQRHRLVRAIDLYAPLAQRRS